MTVSQPSIPQTDSGVELCAICNVEPVKCKARCKRCYDNFRRAEKLWKADGKKRPICSFCRTLLDGSYIMVKVVSGGAITVTLAFHRARCFEMFNGGGMLYLEAKRTGTWRPRPMKLEAFEEEG